METIAACRICGSRDMDPFFDLGKQPLANSLLDQPGQPEATYPLSLSFCNDCSLVQLNETVEPEKLFSHYVWVTGTSKAARDFADDFYKELTARTKDARSGYVLEIASNDGTFLKPFQRGGYKVLGVDPAENIVAMAEQAGMPTVCAFFGAKAAKDIVKQNGPAKMIFARNVMAHVANAHDFVDGFREALSDDGVLAIEAHYAGVILEELQYDSMYHEHLFYYTLKSLSRLLEDHGLYVFDVLRGPISGGAVIVYARKGKGGVSKNVLAWRAEEEKQKMNVRASWEDFAQRAFAHRKKLLGILRDIAKQGDNMVGWGASARSSTLLNFCGIDAKTLPAIIDLNPLKQGRYTAGTHIPIVSAEVGMAKNPKTVLILGWNFAAEITESLRAKFRFQGSCLIPLPNEPKLETIA